MAVPARREQLLAKAEQSQQNDSQIEANLGVLGTLRTNERAVELLEAIDRGEMTSAINAYIVQEALAAFERTQSPAPVDRAAAQTQFLARF